MSENLKALFELLKFCMRMSEATNEVKRYDLSPVANLLLRKAELVQSLNQTLLHDVSEKFLSERHNLAFGKTRVQIVSENGKTTTPFILASACLHPATLVTPELQPHSPMVFDLRGHADTPGQHLHGQELYFELQETKGDILVVCPEA